jgi:hypothetical protein
MANDNSQPVNGSSFSKTECPYCHKQIRVSRLTRHIQRLCRLRPGQRDLRRDLVPNIAVATQGCSPKQAASLVALLLKEISPILAFGADEDFLYLVVPNDKIDVVIETLGGKCGVSSSGRTVELSAQTTAAGRNANDGLKPMLAWREGFLYGDRARWFPV